MIEEGNIEIITSSYDSLWVLFSIVIAIMASYTTLEFSRSLTKAPTTSYFFWLACGSISMGIGIWSMHFVGMLAFQLPLLISYDVGVTLLSLIVAVSVSGFALHAVSHHRMTWLHIGSSGILMGLGISAMHYTGMFAMEMNASMTYLPKMVILSILIAITASMAAIWLTFMVQDGSKHSLLPRKILSAHVMGFAIAGMHYVGMEAVVISAFPQNTFLATELPVNTWLVVFISSATFLLLILSLVAMRVDQHISRKNEALDSSVLRNKQIMDNVSEVIISINEYGIIESFSKSGEKAFGYSAEEIIGKNISCLMPEPYRSQHDGYLRKYVLGEVNNIIGKGAREVSALRKDGSTFPIELSVSEFSLANKNSIFIGVLRDISLRKQIEDDLKKSQSELRESHQQLLQSEKMASIGQLAAGVAHEINNPIGYVSSNIGALKNYVNDIFKVLDAHEQNISALDEEKITSINEARKEANFAYLKEDIVDLLSESMEGINRVKQIVNDLKDFSHVDEAEWLWVDLHKGLDSTLNVIQHEIKYNSEIIKEYGNIPEVECLASQINQVFMNLLINASHSFEDHGTITIRTGTENKEVWIKIIDSGKGIKEQDIKRIFDPFYTTKPVGVGTGLGLSLSYGIIKKHNGRIDVDSTVGKGTCFCVTLPIQHQ